MNEIEAIAELAWNTSSTPLICTEHADASLKAVMGYCGRCKSIEGFLFRGAMTNDIKRLFMQCVNCGYEIEVDAE